MKQILFILSLSLVSFAAQAQSRIDFFGLARKTSGSYDVYLAKVNPADGAVTNVSTSSIASSINLTGAALDPYANKFYFMGANEIKSVDLASGNVTRSVAISNTSGAQYFDNFRFNNSDSQMYGLANKVITTDSAAWSEMYLATLNPTTGVVTNISPTSIGSGSALASSSIDPYNMVFYYSTGLTLLGIDMYTGRPYSRVDITPADGKIFDNIAYSCADTFLYGLIRQNYYDTVYLDSTTYYEVVDSTTIVLAKLNPITGAMVTISPSSIASGGYSLNSGATIDPASLTYYYNNGAELVGVSMVTGRILSQERLSNPDGDMFELMRIPNNCIEATIALRQPPSTTNIAQLSAANTIVYPNPVTDFLTIESTEQVTEATLINALGSVVIRQTINELKSRIDVSTLPNGSYVLRLLTNAGVTNQVIVK
jgi:hypothetical protein